MIVTCMAASSSADRRKKEGSEHLLGIDEARHRRAPSVHPRLSSRVSFATIAKYVLRSKGWFRMWKSFRERPTQPKQYVHAVQSIDFTTYEHFVQRSHATQWLHESRSRLVRQCVQSAQRCESTQ